MPARGLALLAFFLAVGLVAESGGMLVDRLCARYRNRTRIAGL